MAEFSDLRGKTLTKIEHFPPSPEWQGNERIEFTCADGTRYRMVHDQECCENVWLEDINGELDELLNSPILLAERVTNNENPPDSIETTFTWTFYKLSTNRGYVTLRWFGTSNGYYSEEVDFYEV
jgi:hypothetical protein